MTNKEKVIKIMETFTEVYGVNIERDSHIYSACMQMAQWKDEQHAKVINTIKANITEARDNKEYYQANREITLNWILRLIDECHKNVEL